MAPATLDSALKLWEKTYAQLSGVRLSDQPRWFWDGIEAVDRVRELAMGDSVGPVLRDLAGHLGVADDEDGGHHNPVMAVIFANQLQGAYLTDKLLRSAGIDPASL